jgi:hypothetical protein
MNMSLEKSPFQVAFLFSFLKFAAAFYFHSLLSALGAEIS